MGLIDYHFLQGMGQLAVAKRAVGSALAPLVLLLSTLFGTFFPSFSLALFYFSLDKVHVEASVDKVVVPKSWVLLPDAH